MGSGVNRIALIRQIERHGGRLLCEGAVCIRYPSHQNRKSDIRAAKAGDSDRDRFGSPPAARLA